MTFFRRVRALFGRSRRLAELDEEMRLHQELRARANRRQGLAPDDAAQAARVRFGNTLRLREESRDVWSFVSFEQLAKDTRHALRQLSRRPAWTAAVVLTLALGVGANASVFALVDAVLFRPGPGTHPEQLAWIASVDRQSGRVSTLSYPAYAAYRDRATVFSGVLAYSGNQFSLGGRSASLIYGDLVSGNYFDLLSIQPEKGRLLRPSDDAPGAPAVAVLSDGLWHAAFGGDPTVVNSAVTVNGRQFTIIGIAPPGFVGVEFGEDAKLWVPLATEPISMPAMPDLLTDESSVWLRVLGRLRSRASIGSAAAELKTIADGRVIPDLPLQRRPSVTVAAMSGGLHPWNRSQVASVLGLISLVPLLLLLVACANVANVVMAHHLARKREFALRRAIGASRSRLVGQLVIESVFLAGLAGVTGFVASFGLTAVVARVGDVPADVTAHLVPGLRVFIETVVVALLTTALFGLAPALVATRVDLVAQLKAEFGLVAGRSRVRSAFIITQVALSLALLVAAGLFVQSFAKALRVDPGFRPAGAVTLTVDTDLQGYDDARRTTLVDQLLDRAQAIGGVTSASATTLVPLSGRARSRRVAAESGPGRYAVSFAVTPEFFKTLDISVVRGRAFLATDAVGATPVAIVNQSLATSLWPGQDPVGQWLLDGRPPAPALTVVGIARDGRYGDLTEGPDAAFYVPYAQISGPRASPVSFVVRTMGDEASLLRALTGIVKSADPDLPVSDAEPLTTMIHRVAAKQQAAASLLGIFGALSVLLAAIGIYGVASHTASLRTREVGIRIALGATRWDVRRRFLVESLAQALIGVGIGLAMSLAVSRLFVTLLYGLRPTDALTFVAASAILCLVAALASYLPARRASRIDAGQVLRTE